MKLRIWADETTGGVGVACSVIMAGTEVGKADMAEVDDKKEAKSSKGCWDGGIDVLWLFLTEGKQLENEAVVKV